ncbi:hypothetical protein CONLIGDRAFT_607168 [Coniochaeta ligniaria NRRL 30616]|uniref:Uncharacterized protein n=1 Tax=Coniochaeta ligniaria NRRL 30616 TaxID=1408157 RepID=A0A1J7JY59_9PEZI|nr:hypothetical protein CONLIGDRAFT_607168 [Coniochaeta ligniaria NRRL 30616]
MYHIYKRVSPTDDAADEDGTGHVPCHPSRRKTLLVVKDMVLAFLALLGLILTIFNIYDHHNRSIKSTNVTGYATPRQSCYCGESTTEARARGCKYDSLCASWLPDHCRDAELTAEFERSGDGPDGSWLYWADKNHTMPLTVEQVGELANDPTATFHMSGQWHVTHCFFLWRLEHRSRYTRNLFVEGRYDTEKHIVHCLHVVHHPQKGTRAGVSLDGDATGVLKRI